MPGKTREKQFVLNVVRSAVALPQSDPQDRLRVLASAINVATPVDAKLARQLARDAARVEGQVVAAGETPAVSVMSNNQVDCATALEFVQLLAVQAVGRAEQSLIGALTTCEKRTIDVVRAKFDAAMEERVHAPRLGMALMDRTGPKAPWSQDRFVRLFSSLPDAKTQRKEAPNFAAMYAEMAPKVEKSAARRAGLELLEWLNKLDEGPERNLAVNMTTDAMRRPLGEEEYEKALASNVMARQVAQMAGQPAEWERPPEESASVLKAMESRGTDRRAELEKMPDSLRAREAAASGFAAGTSGDRQAAERYFDVAFEALDSVWSRRTPESNAPAVVEEVSEAAAHVDPVAALQRTQKLADRSAQAIGMLAVARVVLGKQ